jgi:hypothetical protein
VKFVLTSILSLFITSAWGQLFDTTTYHNDLSYYTTADNVLHFNFNQQEEDTQLQFGHQIKHDFVNRAIVLNTGRIASPSQFIMYNEPTTDQFQLSTPLFTNWFYNSDSIQYYHSKTPRTDLTYAQGTGNLLHLEATHSQNIASNWSFGLQYNRTKSHNLFYNNLPQFNQERITNLFSTSVFSHFYTPNRKYEVFGNFVNSKNTVKETFGIANPAVFNQLSGREKTFGGEANFYDASNLFIDRTWSITQFYRPGERTVKLNDTTIVADTNTGNITSQWYHKLKYRRHINRFTDGDPNTTLFPIRQVSLETHDSIFHGVLSNKIGRIQKSTIGLLDYWALQEFIQVKQQYFHSSSFNHIRFGGSIKKLVNTSEHTGYAHASILGFYAGDIKATYTFEPTFKKTALITQVGFTSRRPDYNDQFFGSNNYYWNHSLNKTKTTKAHFMFADKLKINRFELDLFSIDQYVYYDTNGVVRQHNAAIQHVRGNVVVLIKFANSWFWNQQLTYQYATNDVLALPEFSTKSRIYKEGFLFNKNMWARVGIDIQYFTPFSGITYNPIVRQMTLSNNEIGGYPIIDFFINSKVKSMELYVSTKHVGQGYFINDSFMAANYPLISRTVQFGVNWRLFD